MVEVKGENGMGRLGSDPQRKGSWSLALKDGAESERWKVEGFLDSRNRVREGVYTMCGKC